MAAGRVFGAILLILSVPVFLAALVAMFSSTELVPQFLGENTGFALLGLGSVLLIGGVVLLVVSPRTKTMVAAPVAGQPVQQIEIKRTEMNWGSNAPKSPTDEMQTELDRINQKIGQAKVRYGVGELSGEAYKMMLEEYEKEKAGIQRRIIEQEK